MVNARKKSFDIAFKHPRSPGIVVGNFPPKRSKPIDRPMSTFLVATRVRVKNECFVKIGIQSSVECMVDESVPNVGFVDSTRFRVVKLKRMV